METFLTWPWVGREAERSHRGGLTLEGSISRMTLKFLTLTLEDPSIYLELQPTRTMSGNKYAGLPDIVRFQQPHRPLNSFLIPQDTAPDIYETDDVFPTLQPTVQSKSHTPQGLY